MLKLRFWSAFNIFTLTRLYDEIKIPRQLRCLFFYRQGVTFWVQYHRFPGNNAIFLLHVLLQTQHCKYVLNRKTWSWILPNLTCESVVLIIFLYIFFSSCNRIKNIILSLDLTLYHSSCMIVTTWIRILSGLRVVAWWRHRMANAWDFCASRIAIQINSTFFC